MTNPRHRNDWELWASQFGWKLSSASRDTAEFCIEHYDGSTSYYTISRRMRDDIDEAIREAQLQMGD